jgi:hypothetical protein
MLVDTRDEAAVWLGTHTAPGDRIGYSDGAYKLPRLPADRVVQAIPRAERAEPFIVATRPEFIVLVPVLRLEGEHEHFLPAAVYRRLRDGSLGYREVHVAEPRTLVGYRAVSFVNPPLRVFARVDLLTPRGIAAGSPPPGPAGGRRRGEAGRGPGGAPALPEPS